MTQYVQRVVGKDGVERLYLRRKGYPRARLSSPWGSDALAAEVKALCEALEPEKVVDNTLRHALRVYELEDADFRGLRDSTKYSYRLMLKEFEETLGTEPLATFTPAFIRSLKNLWARRGYRAANYRLQILKNVLKPAMIDGLVPSNAFDLVGQVRRPSDMKEPHPIWPMSVVERVIEAAIEQRRFGLARAVAIGRFIGARRSDLCVIGKSARQDGRFRFLSGKRRVPVDVREPPPLTRWLELTPDQQPDEARQGRKVQPGARPAAALTLVYNLSGRPYTPDGLGAELKDLVQALHAAGEIPSADYDLHGLRHSRGVEIALTTVSDAAGAAVMGQLSAASFAQYRRQADRMKLTDAVDELLYGKLEQGENVVVKNRVENWCKTPAANKP